MNRCIVTTTARFRSGDVLRCAATDPSLGGLGAVGPIVIGVRIEPELERQLDRLAQLQGRTRSACIREAIQLDLWRGWRIWWSWRWIGLGRGCEVGERQRRESP